MAYVSPLRYPGGKRKLANFIRLIFHHNNLLDGDYVEPYAGGASVALTLLYEEYARHIYINDIDRGLYAFWQTALDQTDNLCRLIQDTPLTMEEWHRQKAIQSDTEASPLALGFSTFFLNRTNRSGIIGGGVIGGKDQTGAWLLDARFNRADLIYRIQKVARYRHRIHLYNLDAIEFIKSISEKLSTKVLIYFDPPYYLKGQQLLYTNFYETRDHENVSKVVSALNSNWIVSYDDVPQIRELYCEFKLLEYDLHYSAQDRYRGDEIMFFCNTLAVPEVKDPAKVNRRELRRHLQLSTPSDMQQQHLNL
jgi:DNA adenine methylase